METRFSLHSSGDRLGTWANNVTHQPSQSWTKTILSTAALGHLSEHKIASPYSLPAASLSFFIDARVWIILASQYVILFSFRNTWSCWFGKGKKSAVQQEYFISAVTSLSKSGVVLRLTVRVWHRGKGFTLKPDFDPQANSQDKQLFFGLTRKIQNKFWLPKIFVLLLFLFFCSLSLKKQKPNTCFCSPPVGSKNHKINSQHVTWTRIAFLMRAKIQGHGAKVIYRKCKSSSASIELESGIVHKHPLLCG